MRLGRLARPTADTPFQISLEWWKRSQHDFVSAVRENACPECQKRFTADTPLDEDDFIDPKTAEVRRINSLWACVIETCSSKPGYLGTELTLATAIFRTLLANGNAPMTPNELCDLLGRSTPETILRVLTGPTAILGILPVE
jgi:hypothetical protein